MKRHNDPNKTNPIGLARYSREFYDTAIAADRDIGMRPGFEIIAPIPVMYLIGHSIELGLKSYLLYMGISLDDLPQKKYGHNLIKSFDKAKELGLLKIVNFDTVEIEGLKVLNELYSTKQLNYIITGSKTFPVFGPIQSFCRKLLNGVCPYVGYKFKVIFWVFGQKNLIFQS